MRLVDNRFRQVIFAKPSFTDAGLWRSASQGISHRRLAAGCRLCFQGDDLRQPEASAGLQAMIITVGEAGGRVGPQISPIADENVIHQGVR